MDWDTNDKGELTVAQVTAFQVAPGGGTHVLLRIEGRSGPGGTLESIQFSLEPEAARQLANALLKSAENALEQARLAPKH